MGVHLRVRLSSTSARIPAVAKRLAASVPGGAREIRDYPLVQRR